MPEFSAGGLMVRGTPIEFKAAAAEGASTTHAAFDSGPYGGSLFVTVAVTASSGTLPTLTVIAEGSADGVNWVTLGTIGANGYASGTTASAPTNFTAAATTRAVFTGLNYVRTRSVVGGTGSPSFTYSVEGVIC